VSLSNCLLARDAVDRLEGRVALLIERLAAHARVARVAQAQVARELPIGFRQAHQIRDQSRIHGVIAHELERLAPHLASGAYLIDERR
jgi:hypothetical protein